MNWTEWTWSVMLTGKERVDVEDFAFSLVLIIGRGRASESGGCRDCFFEVGFFGLDFGGMLWGGSVQMWPVSRVLSLDVTKYEDLHCLGWLGNFKGFCFCSCRMTLRRELR